MGRPRRWLHLGSAASSYSGRQAGRACDRVTATVVRGAHSRRPSGCVPQAAAAVAVGRGGVGRAYGLGGGGVGAAQGRGGGGRPPGPHHAAVRVLVAPRGSPPG